MDSVFRRTIKTIAQQIKEIEMLLKLVQSRVASIVAAVKEAVRLVRNYSLHARLLTAPSEFLQSANRIADDVA